jgi:predicted nucleotidyltransferase
VVSVQLPADIARLLAALRDRLLARGDLVGVYLYGSLVTGDFSPARSDIDVLVMLEREPGKAAVSELRRLHLELARGDAGADRGGAAGRGNAGPGRGGAAGRLHCLYVSAEAPADPGRDRAYWFGDRMTRWRLKVLTRAELFSAGMALHGPWPPPGMAPVPAADLRAAVRAEITGYWRSMARRRWCWLADSWVDFGLITLPRAEAVLTSGELITKGEAIGRLSGFGVPAALAEEIRARRAGDPVRLSAPRRIRRARLARRIMRRGVLRLGP